MKRLPCDKCAQVKAEAMAQLGLINDWQARAMDLEAALRQIAALADLVEHDSRGALIKCGGLADAALAPIDADNAQTSTIAGALK